MKRSLFTLIFCLSAGFIFSQTEGDYRTCEVGNWNQVQRWQVFYNGSWKNILDSNSGPYYEVVPSSGSGVITVNHNIIVSWSTTVNQLIISNGVQLTIWAGKTLTVVDDFTQTPILVNATAILKNLGALNLQTQLSVTPCQIYGTLISSEIIQISNAELLSFNSGSTYQHAKISGGAIPLATWNINSTCLINGLTASNPLPPTNLGQSFGNFTWNTPAMGATTTFSLSGGLKTVNGDLTFISTGAAPREIRFDNGGGGYNLSVGGNFIIQSGIITLSQSQTSATSIKVGGNLDLSGGTLTFGTSNNSAINILLSGALQKTGGTLARGTGTGSCTILPYQLASN